MSEVPAQTSEVQKKPRARKTVAAAPEAAEAPVAPVATEEAPVTESSMTEEEVTLSKIDAVNAKIEEVTKGLKTLTVEIKSLRKDYVKIMKKNATLEKSKRRKRAEPALDENGNPVASPNVGIKMPLTLSPELTAFLGLDAGTQKTRPEVTKLMKVYIDSNNLLSKVGKKSVIDLTKDGSGKLASLLKIDPSTNLDYFKMQTYLKPHFPKSKKDLEAEKIAAEKVSTAAIAPVPAEAETKAEPRRRRRAEEAAAVH